jgi:hypothetical protein
MGSAKTADVLETYERPYDAKQPVVRLDEKPVALHADVWPPSAAAPGREAWRDNENKLCERVNVFCAVGPKVGRQFTFPRPDRSGFEFSQTLFRLAVEYRKADAIHLVINNLNIHRRKSLSHLYGAKVADENCHSFTVHYTSTHGSRRGGHAYGARRWSRIRDEPPRL